MLSAGLVKSNEAFDNEAFEHEALLASDRHPILTPPTLFSLFINRTDRRENTVSYKDLKKTNKKKKHYTQTGLYRINLIAANTDAKEIKTSIHFHIPPVRVVLSVISLETARGSLTVYEMVTQAAGMLTTRRPCISAKNPGCKVCCRAPGIYWCTVHGIKALITQMPTGNLHNHSITHHHHAENTVTCPSATPAASICMLSNVGGWTKTF